MTQDFVKRVSWYDNEAGYRTWVLDLISYMDARMYAIEVKRFEGSCIILNMLVQRLFWKCSLILVEDDRSKTEYTRYSCWLA